MLALAVEQAGMCVRSLASVRCGPLRETMGSLPIELQPVAIREKKGLQTNSQG
jgi:hypothetical protein